MAGKNEEAKTPMVSVIIPTYNRAGPVAHAIRSVLNQSFADFELIIVDDGSTDLTRPVVNNLAATDSRLRYIGQPNQGRSAARNAGIRLSRGRYIAFLDSDDAFLPNKLQSQMDAFKQHPDLGMVYHPVVMVDETGADMYGGAPLPGHLSGQIYPELLFVRGTIISTPSVMVRHDVLGQVGLFDEALHVCEDLDLWRRVARYYPVLQLNEPLAVICIRQNEPVAIFEKVQARLVYYQKALADDPDLRRTIWPKLLGEMFWSYGALAFFYRDWRTGLPLLVRSAWYDPTEFGRSVWSGASRRWSLHPVIWFGKVRASVRFQLERLGQQAKRLVRTLSPRPTGPEAGPAAGLPAKIDIRAALRRALSPRPTGPEAGPAAGRPAKIDMRAALRRLRRRVFDVTIGSVVRKFPLQVADRLAALVSDRVDDPAQAAFAQHGYKWVPLAKADKAPVRPAAAVAAPAPITLDQPDPLAAAVAAPAPIALDQPDLLAAAEFVANQLAHEPGNPAYNIFYRHGFHLLRQHFYLPIPDRAELQYEFAAQSSAMIGLEMKDDAYLALLEQAFSPYMDEFRALFPLQRAADPRQFYLLNDFYMAVDAHVYYAMIRHFKPRRIIEIGAGFSTLLAAAACARNQELDGQTTQLIAIEPYPLEVLRSGIPYLAQLVECKVQEVEMSRFTELEAGDILFIDSSHVLRGGGDVHMEYLEILPRLAPGVLVHIHDISLPKSYPDVYFDSQLFWNEQYLLQAFLAFNHHFEVVWPANYMAEKHLDRICAVFPEFQVMRQHYPKSEPTAFWMRVRPPAPSLAANLAGNS